jgi:hypothetical protein
LASVVPPTFATFISLPVAKADVLLMVSRISPAPLLAALLTPSAAGVDGTRTVVVSIARTRSRRFAVASNSVTKSPYRVE